MTVSELEDLFEEIKQVPCGDSWIEVFGKEYITDVAYAFDGMEIFLDAVRRRFGNEQDMERRQG